MVAGAHGLSRIGKRWARSAEADILDRAKPPEKDPGLQMFTRLSALYDPPTSNWIETHLDEYRPTAGQALARRERPHVAARELGIVVPEIVANRYEGMTASAVFEILAVGPGVTSVARGDKVIAAAFAGRDAKVLGRDLVLLRTPEFRCKASGFDLATDTIYGGAWAWTDDRRLTPGGELPIWEPAKVPQTMVVRRIPNPDPTVPDGATEEDAEMGRASWKLVVRREPNEHGTARGRRDGCSCGGDIHAVLTQG